MRTWINRLRQAVARPAARPRRGSRPGLEELEGRLVPSTSPLLGSFPGLSSAKGPLDTTPSHASVAAGPNYLVETDQSNLVIIKKTTGAQQGLRSLASLFGTGPGQSVYDPVVKYDPQISRFVVAALEASLDSPLPAAHLLVAVSKSADPTQGFTPPAQILITEYIGGFSLRGDSLQFGWNHDVDVFSMNMVYQIAPTSGGHHELIVAFPKSQLQAAIPAPTPFNYDVDPSLGMNIVPATMDRALAGGPMYFVQAFRSSPDAPPELAIAKVTSSSGTLDLASLRTDTTPLSLPFDYAPVPATQPGGGTIDVGDDSANSVCWVNGKLAFTRTAASVVGSTKVDQAHYYVVDTRGATPALVEQGAINRGAGMNTFNPAIAVAWDGDLAMTFLVSGPTQYPAAYVTGQIALSETTMEPPTFVDFGGSDDSARLGLSAAVAVDPATGLSCWGVNTLPTGIYSNWYTRVVHFTPLARLPANAQWVYKGYMNVLNSGPDPGGYSYWLGRLDTGTITQDGFMQALLNGTEYHNNLVRTWYEDYLRRPADTGGLTYWSGVLAGGATQESVQAQILGGTEYFSRVCGSSNGQFVDNLYRDVLHRLADPLGYAFWTGRLAAGVSRGDVALTFLTGTERWTNVVNSTYQKFLNRTPFAGENAYWVSRLQAGLTDQDLDLAFLTSAEFKSRSL